MYVSAQSWPSTRTTEPPEVGHMVRLLVELACETLAHGHDHCEAPSAKESPRQYAVEPVSRQRWPGLHWSLTVDELEMGGCERGRGEREQGKREELHGC